MRTHTQSYPERLGHRPLSACLLASALALVVASGLLLVAPAAWSALTSTEPSTLARCASLSGEPERLACYDRVEKDALRPPARGATAIFRTH
jgi:hypothetical protein